MVLYVKAIKQHKRRIKILLTFQKNLNILNIKNNNKDFLIYKILI